MMVNYKLKCLSCGKEIIIQGEVDEWTTAPDCPECTYGEMNFIDKGRGPEGEALTLYWPIGTIYPYHEETCPKP